LTFIWLKWKGHWPVTGELGVPSGVGVEDGLEVGGRVDHQQLVDPQVNSAEVILPPRPVNPLTVPSVWGT
jgi:hypothetical protein